MSCLTYETSTLAQLVVSPIFLVTVVISISTLLLLERNERIVFVVIKFYILMVAPGLKCWLQHYKEKFHGPWDIAHVEEHKIPKHPTANL